MNAAIVSVIRFGHPTLRQLTLNADVCLIAFRDAQSWIETPRESCIQSPELSDQRRRLCQRLRKSNLRQHGGTLRDRNVVCVEKQLLSTQRKVINRAQ